MQALELPGALKRVYLGLGWATKAGTSHYTLYLGTSHYTLYLGTSHNTLYLGTSHYTL